jgi:hypothetical protein
MRNRCVGTDQVRLALSWPLDAVPTRDSSLAEFEFRYHTRTANSFDDRERAAPTN